MRALILGAAGALFLSPADAQQVPDRDVDISVASPVFARDTGPVVSLDAAHFNFHKLDGRFETFGNLLRNDGFRLRAFTDPFSADSLSKTQVLVISNALNKVNVGNWRGATPSAFTAEEIAAVKAWVGGGGALLLIADHFPFAGNAADLASAFGFEFYNAYAMPKEETSSDAFVLEDGTLKDDMILHGRSSAEVVRKVVTFTGSAFTAPSGARPILTLPQGFHLEFRTDSSIVTPETPRTEAGGLLQGAVMAIGKGRIAVFGEAAMFSAQRLGPAAEPMGFNAPGAEGNKQFILNLMRWLAQAT